MRKSKNADIPSERIMTVLGAPYVNFRSTPNNDPGNIIEVLMEGNQVAATTEVGEYTGCRYGSKYGYVMTKYLK